MQITEDRSFKNSTFVSQNEAVQRLCQYLSRYADDMKIDINLAKKAHSINEFFVTVVVPHMAEEKNLLSASADTLDTWDLVGLDKLEQYGSLVLAKRN